MAERNQLYLALADRLGRPVVSEMPVFVIFVTVTN